MCFFQIIPPFILFFWAVYFMLNIRILLHDQQKNSLSVKSVSQVQKYKSKGKEKLEFEDFSHCNNHHRTDTIS